ncbi:hypothetical protein D3Z55_08000 [Clostridiaceae bacterium]|nr:hypothetical protein [Clostridiaceae bacterium]
MIGYNTLYHISTDNDKTSERKIRPGNSGLLGLSIKNMKVKLKVANIREGKWYYGFITRQYQVDSKLRVCVELDEAPGIEYMKVVPIDDSPNSKFASFARKLDIIDENGVIDTDELEGMAVKAILRRLKDGSIFIQTLLIDYDYYEEEEDTDEGEG